MPDPTVTEKPKPRRRRAKRPASDPTAPKKPRVTLLSRIEAMGPTHLSAYRTLAQGNAAFTVALAAAMDADAVLKRAEAKRDAADAAVHRADAEYRAALDVMNDAKAILSKLDTLARQIAAARGDVPATDDAHTPTVAPTSGAD